MSLAARDSQIELLFRNGRTLQEIGCLHTLTRQRVQQILKRRGVKAGDGGSHCRSQIAHRKRAAAKDAVSLAKHGCSFDDYRKLRGRTTKAFARQRDNAKRRGIEWRLTLWQWWNIWQQSGHWHERGRGQGYVMCRKEDSGCYEVGNVFIASARLNSSETKRKKSALPIGVTFNKGRFYAKRQIKGELRLLGSYASAEKAGLAYELGAPLAEAEE